MNSPVLHSKMNDAYRQLRCELFCEETCLIYDSISSHTHAQRFNHLPSVEEIQLAVPNPHGYATGMEDCMLNAGFAMEMCVLRSGLGNDTRIESEEFARLLLAGMMQCATVHGQPGYVVRGISPLDGRSCYMESSRDQFTLFVYGLWRYYHVAFSTPEEKHMIRQVLCQVADYTQSRMTEQYQYNLGRLDGQPGMHLKMLDVQSHEAMRLPMCFAAAYDVTGDEHYERLYQQYYTQAIDDSYRFPERKRPWWHIELSQMQFSLSLCCKVDGNLDHRKQMNELMSMVARAAQTQALDYYFPRLCNYQGAWQPMARSWRSAEKLTIQLFNDQQSSLYKGKLYLKGEESPEFKEAFDRIRAAGNLAVTVSLAEQFVTSSEFVDRFVQSATAPEYAGHTSGALVNMLCAYYMVLRQSLISVRK